MTLLIHTTTRSKNALKNQFFLRLWQLKNASDMNAWGTTVSWVKCLRKLLIYITNLQRGRYWCSPALRKTHKQNVDTTSRNLHRQHVRVVCPPFLIRHGLKRCLHRRLHRHCRGHWVHWWRHLPCQRRLHGAGHRLWRHLGWRGHLCRHLCCHLLSSRVGPARKVPCRAMRRSRLRGSRRVGELLRPH